MKSSLEFTGLF